MLFALQKFFYLGKSIRFENSLDRGRQRAVAGVDVDDIVAVEHARARFLALHVHHQMHRSSSSKDSGYAATGRGGEPDSRESRSHSRRSATAAALLGRASSASGPISTTAAAASPLQPSTTLAAAYRPGMTLLSA